jgi:hypothetical protein
MRGGGWRVPVDPLTAPIIIRHYAPDIHRQVEALRRLLTWPPQPSDHPNERSPHVVDAGDGVREPATERPSQAIVSRADGIWEQETTL